VSPSRGERLLPLVRWALESPREIRQRILGIVDDTLSWHGREAAAAPAPEGEPAAEPQAAANPSVLVAVARVLHAWSPSDRILGPRPGEDEDGAE
jgi:hypothetical protein